MSGLVIWVSELILWVFGSGRVGSGRAAGSAGSAGSGELDVWGKTHFGNLYLKKTGRKSGHFSERVLIYGS